MADLCYGGPLRWRAAPKGYSRVYSIVLLITIIIDMAAAHRQSGVGYLDLTCTVSIVCTMSEL